MKTIEFKDQVYNLISDYSEMNLITYKKIQEVFPKKATELEKRIEIISILSNIPHQDLINSSEVSIFQIDLNWLANKIQTEIQSTIEINDTTYHFIKDLTKISVKEYLAMDKFTQETEDPYQNLHYLSAVMYRPEDEITTYDENKLEDRANLFLEHLPLSVFFSLVNFFLSIKLTAG